jgi:hypothetical protein
MHPIARRLRLSTRRRVLRKPHNRAQIDGDITYGDASIALEFIEREWRIADRQANSIDPGVF